MNPTRAPRAARPWTASRVLFWIIAATVVTFAPLAIGYMWHFFDPGAPRWQASVTEAFVDREYAIGKNSVEGVRAVDYANHRVVMLIHTSLGGMALALSMFQFSARLRSRRPAAHRWIGRTYLVLMTTSMLTAIIFLLRAPVVEYGGGSAFDLQLWALALATLSSAGYAFWSIRNRDIISHQAWMGLNISLMMTAPLLRVLWIGLGRVVPGSDLLTNLGAGAVSLGILAPSGGAIAFLLTRRSRIGGIADRAAPRWYGVITVIGVLGTALTTIRYAALPDEFPREMLSVHLVPLVAYVLVCGVAARRAHRDGRFTAERQWRLLLTGAAFIPVSVNIIWLVAVPVYGSIDGYLAATMVGAPGPIIASFAVVVHEATTRRPRKASVEPATKIPVASA